VETIVRVLRENGSRERRRVRRAVVRTASERVGERGPLVRAIGGLLTGADRTPTPLG
jgi:hypothetical protein